MTFTGQIQLHAAHKALCRSISSLMLSIYLFQFKVRVTRPKEMLSGRAEGELKFWVCPAALDHQTHLSFKFLELNVQPS